MERNRAEGFVLGQDPRFWRFGRVEFHEGRWELRVGGQPVELEPKPLGVLAFLLRHANEAVTRDELMLAVWPGQIVVDAALTNAMGKLRKAIGDEDGSLILTVPRVGYRFCATANWTPVAEIPPESRLSLGDPVPGRSHWVLERRLDQGLASEVWLARQTKTQELRVIKFSLDGSRLATLRRELTISRLLQASFPERDDFLRVLDFNFEAAPYFIEYPLAGSDLLGWAESRGGIGTLSRDERLKLFLRVCDAVAAAHSAGVLHKDLKPGNILIEESGSILHLRVADFGSGEVMDPDRLEQLNITRQGLTRTFDSNSVSGTPLYLAPEVLAGQSPTTRSDVYALGVLLYQLMVGDLRRPLSMGFESEIDDSLLAEDIQRAAQGDPALRPAGAAELAESIRRLEMRRSEATETAQLAQRAQEAERRLLVEQSRRPWLIATVAVLLVGVLAASGFAFDAARKGAEAQRQYELANAIGSFLLQDIIAAANPVEAGRSNLTVREALDAAAPRIPERFGNKPATAAAVHNAMGKSYHLLTAFEQALDQLQQGEAELARAGLVGSDLWLDNRLFQAETLARLSRIPEAQALFAELKPQFDGRDDLSLNLQIRLAQTEAQLEFMRMNFPGAIPPLERAVELVSQLDPPDPGMSYRVRLALVSARSRGGMAEQAGAEADAIVQALEAERGARAPITLGARHTRLRNAALLGKERELVGEYRQLVKDLSEVLGADYEVTVLARQGLVHIYSKTEQWEDVEREAISLEAHHAQRIGESGMHTLALANSAGLAMLRQGRTQEGVAYLRERVALADAAHGDGHMLGSALRLNLAHGLLTSGDSSSAQTVVAYLKEKGGMLFRVDSDAAGELALLEGWLALQQDRRDEAIPHLERARQELGKKNPEDYWLLRQTGELLTAAMSASS